MEKTIRLNPEQMQMVRALADNNMNTTWAAHDLHRCRSGLQYQLNKIFELTGLNPQNFYDLHELLQAEVIG